MNARPKCFAHSVERRQFGRRQTFLHAMITGSGRPPVPCIVRDLSASGARIEVQTPAWLPRHFRLIVEGTLRSECEVVHRSTDAVGVRFAARNANRS
jgi:PilZ domain-containing protein